MKNIPYCLLVLVLVGFYSPNEIQAQTDSLKQADMLKFTVGKTVLNKSLWSQPYRFEDKNLKALTCQIIIDPTSKKNQEVDLNSFILMDEENKLRIRPNSVYYYRADKKMYMKLKSVNQNYNTFKETIVDGFENFEATTHKTNFFGRKKKKHIPSVKLLKKVTIKGKKATYYIDYPVTKDFKYGKIYYKNNPIGFTAVKN